MSQKPEDQTAPLTVLLEEWDDDAKKAYLSGGQVLSNFHRSDDCWNQRCPVHNPSDHAYRDYPLHFLDNRYMVRLSEGFPHNMMIDPDDPMLALAVKEGADRLILRNSAYCETCDEVAVSTRRYDYHACKGKHVRVDGGYDAIHRVYGNEKVEHVIETSITISIKGM